MCYQDRILYYELNFARLTTDNKEAMIVVIKLLCRCYSQKTRFETYYNSQLNEGECITFRSRKDGSHEKMATNLT